MATKVERHLLRINADRSINVETDIPIVAGSIGVDEVLITFEEPEDWQDMSLTVTMVSSVVDTPYTVLWDGVSAFNVPWELTQEVGVIGFSVLGISSSSQTYQRGLTQSSVGLITIVTPGINVGEPPVEPTPSAYERVLAMIESLPEVENRAEAVINDLDNAFRGVAQYLPVGMGNVVTAELDGTDSELVQASDAFKNGKLLGAKVYGKSEQFSTTGAQLWEFGDLTFTKVRTVTFSEPLPAGTYTVSANVESNDTDDTRRLFYAMNASGNLNGQVFLANGSSTGAFTANEEIYRINLYASNTMVNSDGDTATWSNIMLNSGSTALPYEPYTGGIASPNPDYPQEIKSVAEGDVWVRGKNVFSPEYIHATYFKYDNGVISNVNVDSKASMALQARVLDKNNAMISGSTVNIGGITAAGMYHFTFKLPVRSGGVTLEIKHNGSTRDLILARIPYNLFKNAGDYYTLSLDCLRFDLATVDGTALKNVQLERGSEYTDYEPYVSPDSLHFLPDDIEPLRSLPDGTRDVLTIDANGNGVIERNVGVLHTTDLIFGQIGYNDYTPNMRPNINLPGSIYRTRGTDLLNVYSSIFVPSYAPVSSPSNPIYRNTIAVSGGRAYIVLDKETYPTKESFYEFIQNADDQIFYQLATPITEIIPASRMPKVPSQYLHAWLEAKDQNGEEIVTDYSVYYEKSIGALLSQIEQALDAAGYPITDYEPEDAMSVAPVLSNDANPVTDAQMAAAVTYGFTLN